MGRGSGGELEANLICKREEEGPPDSFDNSAVTDLEEFYTSTIVQVLKNRNMVRGSRVNMLGHGSSRVCTLGVSLALVWMRRGNRCVSSQSEEELFRSVLLCVSFGFEKGVLLKCCENKAFLEVAAAFLLTKTLKAYPKKRQHIEQSSTASITVVSQEGTNVSTVVNEFQGDKSSNSKMGAFLAGK